MAALQNATVVTLKQTGHVLSVIAAGEVDPPLEQLAGAGADGTDDPGHLRVRIPGGPDFVNVPIDELETKRVKLTDDLLDRPQSFAVVDGNTQDVGAPKYGTQTDPKGVAGKKVVVVWQTPDESIPVDTVLDSNGDPPTNAPTGATQKLVSYEGGPLYVVEVP